MLYLNMRTYTPFLTVKFLTQNRLHLSTLLQPIWSLEILSYYLYDFVFLTFCYNYCNIHHLWLVSHSYSAVCFFMTNIFLKIVHCNAMRSEAIAKRTEMHPDLLASRYTERDKAWEAYKEIRHTQADWQEPTRHL